MAVWRIQTNTSKGDVAEYCINNSVAAVGWSLPDEIFNKIKRINTFQEYCDISEYESTESVNRLAEETKANDLIWMKHAGIYYIGRVEENSKWQFNVEARKIDAANQLTNIVWQKVSDNADEAAVPGAVTTSFIRGSTFQRIRKAGVEEYSQILYNKFRPGTYKELSLKLNEDNFYSMLQPSDVEDLLCMWLFEEKGLVCIPSTNKLSTEKYECVLLDKNSGDHAYIQVKKGVIDLDAKDYTDLNGNVYLLTTEGKVHNCESCSNVHEVSPTVIYEYALLQGTLIPEAIKNWICFLAQEENKHIREQNNNGIIFDTNQSYCQDDESLMLDNNMICARGKAKQAIEKFIKNDIVFLYSKGEGIIAAGKIISGEKFEFDNGQMLKVEPIVPRSFSEVKKKRKTIKPSEISDMTGRKFCWQNTIKYPFLTMDQAERIIKLLEEKYKKI